MTKQKQHRPVIWITGSSGLIGSALAHRLASDYQIVALDIREADLPEGASYFKCDLTSDESVRKTLDAVRQQHGNRIASVIHLAAYYDFSGEPSSLYEELTVRGTERLLEALASGFETEQFVFSSTMLVHAPTTPGHPIDENHPLEPKWDYPESKMRAENTLDRFAASTPTVVLRIAGIYDDYGHSPPLVNQIQRIAERRLTSRVYPGNLEHGQAFLHLEDLLEAIERIIARRAELPARTTFVLAEEETLGYGELQRRFGELLHHEPWVTEYVPKPIAKVGAWMQDKLPGEDPFIKPWMVDLANDHYEVDAGHARELLGWQPRHSLRETLPRLVASLRTDPDAWYREHGLGESAPELSMVVVSERPH